MRIAFLLLVLLSQLGVKAQTSNHQLTPTQIDALFTPDIKTNFNISYNIYRGYQYQDKLGTHYILMTHDPIRNDDKEKSYSHIKARYFDVVEGSLKLKRTVLDMATDGQVSEEHNISFWTKFFELDDYDQDGTIDPILIYGTYGNNGTDDGRIIIIITHKHKRYAIRHQNSTLDFERSTQIDEGFYVLPVEIQQQVKKQMQAIVDNGSGIFPNNWEEGMKEGKLELKE